MKARDGGASEAPAPVWLSGPILTLLNKVVFPIAWFVLIGGALVPVLLQEGHIAIAGDFRLIAGFVVIASVFLVWMTARLQGVGYRGKTLVVGNYWRQAVIPFEQVEAVEPVWWYRGRMVRVRFRGRTPFGRTVYYLVRWGPLRAMVSSPEEDLRQILRTSRSD